METVFLILYIISSSMGYSIASDQQLGFNPYPFGTTILCFMLHIPILVSSIFYLGWVCGIVCFLLHLFGITYGTIGWMFNIPTLVAKNEQQLFRFLNLKLKLLSPTLVASIIFTVVSFFVSDFKSLLGLFQKNSTFTVMFIIIVVILSGLRIVFSKILSYVDEE